MLLRAHTLPAAGYSENDIARLTHYESGLQPLLRLTSHAGIVMRWRHHCFSLLRGLLQTKFTASSILPVPTYCAS
jgi:hypothetical protein